MTRGISVTWTGSPALEEQIVAYEKAHGLTFPDDYRKFLSEVNGGVPLRRYTPRRAFNVVARLFELDAARDEANLWSAQMRFATRIPPPLLPIGESTSGCIICIGLLGPVRGRVLSYDLHQREASPVSSSFDEFLELSQDNDAPRHLRLVD